MSYLNKLFILHRHSFSHVLHPRPGALSLCLLTSLFTYWCLTSNLGWQQSSMMWIIESIFPFLCQCWRPGCVPGMLAMLHIDTLCALRTAADQYWVYVFMLQIMKEIWGNVLFFIRSWVIGKILKRCLCLFHFYKKV